MSTVPLQISRLQLSTLEFDRASMVNLRASETLQQGYQQQLTTQQANAPVLTVQVNGPGVYAGTDGKKYLVPAAQLAFRANLPRTPEISFTSDGKTWKIITKIQLVRPPGSDTTAIPLLMDSYSVEILSGDQTPSFTFSTVTPLSAPNDATEVVGLLKAEGIIAADLALTLLGKTQTSRLAVIGNLSYRYSYTRRLEPPPSPGPVGPVRYERLLSPAAMTMTTAHSALKTSAVDEKTMIRERVDYQVNPALLPQTETVIQGITSAQSLANNIPTHFDPSLMDFKPIYAVIMGTGSDGTVWSRQTGQGYSRPSSGSEAYYVLPDSFRLALDANSGMPSMSILLIETPPASPGGSTSFALRVRLALAPLLDGERLEKMRESLRSSQNILYAQLGIGGYSSATFVPSAMFTGLPGFQSGVSAGGASSAVDAANGFELVLDCSLEFYTLLTKLLCSVDGLQGSVQFQIVTSHLDATPPVETSLMVSVPVVLSFAGPSPIKLTPQVTSAINDSNATSISVSLTNPLKVPLKVAGIYPTLMTNDPDLGVTIGATLLKPSTDPVSLAAAEQQVIAMSKPDNTSLPVYTALATDFGTCTPTFDPASVLNHYQELVATSGIHASAHFNCYLLKHVDQIPPSLANLIGMQIEVQHGDGAVITVPLTRDNPSSDIAIPYTFAELLAGLSLDQPTFKYRAKSIFTDHSGTFSDWIVNTGANVEVTAI